MARGVSRDTPTRIQREKTTAILDAALIVFAGHGFRGATLDRIAEEARISKPNLLYYFASKEQIHSTLLKQLLDKWLDPLRSLDAAGDPISEICAYVLRKLELARDFPLESRLFANEVISGAPHILSDLRGPLKTLVDEKSGIIQKWADDGRIASVPPRHLIFSIWASTQHYADFDTQVEAVLGQDDDTRFEDAGIFLSGFYARALRP